eukprot:gene6843-7611_t
MAQDDATFRQSLLNTLAAAFSVNQEERSFSEDQLKIFETTEGFGVHLTSIIIDSSIPEPIRQLASVVLKQYVEGHWSHVSAEKFKPPETSEEAKALIRQSLPKALQDPSSKIRSSVAYALSSIAHWDWPEDWPGFFDLLVQAINSGEQNLIHGAVRVMTEFVKEVSDLQMPHVAPIILPNVLHIIQHPETYELRTRSRAIDIFNTVADLVALMKEVYKTAGKELLYPLLPSFVAAFVKELSTPDGDMSDCGLKKEVFKALQTLIKGFPRVMADYLQMILSPIWVIFTESVEFYIRTTVNNVVHHQDPVDEDGEVLSFENLIFGVFEFITALVEVPKYKKAVKGYLEDIIFYVLMYMQITEEQIELWSEDVNKFIEDEDEESFSCSVRISAQYLLMRLCEKFQSACAQCLINSIMKIQEKGRVQKSNGDSHWWKYHEVCCVALGIVQPRLVEMLEKNQLKFDADEVIVNFLSGARKPEAYLPFLHGQALWCSSRYVASFSIDSRKSSIDAAVCSVHENHCQLVRMFAVKSLFSLCDQLKQSNDVRLIEPHLPAITNGLVSFASQVTDSALALTLESLDIILTVNKEFTGNYATAGNLIPLINALFLKYGADIHLSSVLGEIFGTLSSNKGCFQMIVDKTVPMLTSVFEAPADKIPHSLVPPSLDLMTEIIRNCSQPLPEVLITRSFPATVQCILKSEDFAVIQNGGECLRAFVSCGIDQISNWHDSNGHNGLDYVLQVTTYLLDPKVSENSAVFVGKLINTLVIKVGAALGDNLQALLRAVLSKLQQADSLNVVQSLLMVFIQMIRYQLEMTFEFLSLVPDPTGKAALDFVLTEWCNKQNSFYGTYERKASCDALCKVLQYALNKQDQRFQEILVPGDEINCNKGTKEYTEIPVGIKIFKLIVNELSNELEKDDPADEDEDEDNEEDSDWEDVDDDSENQNSPPKDLTVQGLIEAMFAPSSDYQGFDLGSDDDAIEDDPDVKSDHINEVDMKAPVMDGINLHSFNTCFKHGGHL